MLADCYHIGQHLSEKTSSRTKYVQFHHRSVWTDGHLQSIWTIENTHSEPKLPKILPSNEELNSSHQLTCITKKKKKKLYPEHESTLKLPTAVQPIGSALLSPLHAFILLPSLSYSGSQKRQHIYSCSRSYTHIRGFSIVMPIPLGGPIRQTEKGWGHVPQQA